MSLVALVAWIVALATGGLLLGRIVARRRAEAWSAGMRQVTEAIRGAADTERVEILRTAEISARDEARGLGSAFESFCQVREAELATVQKRVSRRVEDLAGRTAELGTQRKRLDEIKARVEVHEKTNRALREESAANVRAALQSLEQRAGETKTTLRAFIIDSELEDTRLNAAQTLRLVDQVPPDERSRDAKRIMSIAVGRFSGHYLTERLLSNIPIPPGAAGDTLIGSDEANLRAIEGVAGVKLALAETRESIRLEGLDGVGREVARRCLARLGRAPAGAVLDIGRVTETAREIAHQLDRELMDLGRRAFKDLEIPAAHAEIVKLVGRLNYRTSFTQNQWKHAVEAAFLCGMMAEEMDLDIKLARRAALMHDIGKALTHELDGSHAVIGADYARRLGEHEVVANAIGAHHTDEPFNSPYAYLVAAADAMSGARPGARRQMEDNYVARLDDLERITRSFRGIDEAFAVQGGREVRVYVSEDSVDDMGAVTLSSQIANKISTEMTFPGQIRVTVIREFKAVETAS